MRRILLVCLFAIGTSAAASSLKIADYNKLPAEDEAVLAAPNVAERHLLRPIPQGFIDALQNQDGTNLSDADKAAWQNPGY